MPARPAYAAAEAAVLPVDAQTTPRAPAETARLTATVMPRSLNDPVGLLPSIFSQTGRASCRLSRSDGTRGVPPSWSVTTRSVAGNRAR